MSNTYTHSDEFNGDTGHKRNQTKYLQWMKSWQWVG